MQIATVIADVRNAVHGSHGRLKANARAIRPRIAAANAKRRTGVPTSYTARQISRLNPAKAALRRGSWTCWSRRASLAAANAKRRRFWPKRLKRRSIVGRRFVPKRLKRRQIVGLNMNTSSSGGTRVRVRARAPHQRARTRAGARCSLFSLPEVTYQIGRRLIAICSVLNSPWRPVLLQHAVRANTLRLQSLRKAWEAWTTHLRTTALAGRRGMLQ